MTVYPFWQIFQFQLCFMYILQVHRQICQFNESPILVKLDPLMRQSETVPVKCYESVIDIVEGNATMLLVELTYSLVTEVSAHLIYT